MKSRWEGKRLLFIESGQKLYFRGYQLFQLGVLGDCGTASAVKRGRPKGEAQRPRAQEMKHKIKQRLYLCPSEIFVSLRTTTSFLCRNTIVSRNVKSITFLNRKLIVFGFLVSYFLHRRPQSRSGGV